MKIIERPHLKLYRESSLEEFLAIPPRAPNGLTLAWQQLEGREYQRQALSDLLVDYNGSLGQDAFAIENAKRLGEEGSVCVVTGQQLGMMGGPMYTILKAITCLLVAREAGAIPIFWWATEDHDVGEIDHTYLLDPMGNLEKFYLPLPKDGRFVEDLVLQEKHFEELKRFQKAAGISFDLSETSYSRLMLRVLAKLFSGTGLVFLEPHLLRPFAGDFFKKEIKQADEINAILKETTQQLVEAGGREVLDFESETNLFWKGGHYRRKVPKNHPINNIFSTNVAARPVLQSLLLPVLAYVAGPTELSYYHQLKEYHAFHNVPMPWIVPRLSATFIPPYAEEMLQKCRLKPWEEIPRHWAQVVPHIEEGMEEVQKQWHDVAVKQFREILSPETILSAIRHYARKFQRKVTLSRLRHQGIPPHSLHLLHNLIHPHEKLQERVLNWWAFQGETDENLIQTLLEEVDWRTEGHLYCFI